MTDALSGSPEVPRELIHEVEEALKKADDSPEAILRDTLEGFKALTTPEQRDSYIQKIEEDLEHDAKGLTRLSDNVRTAFQNFMRLMEAPDISIIRAEDEAIDMYKRLNNTAAGNAYHNKCLSIIGGSESASVEDIARAMKYVELYKKDTADEN